MLFVKQELRDGVTISVEITNDNVFANCLGCGQEVHVDLAAESDELRAEDVFCNSCLHKLEKKRRKQNNKHKEHFYDQIRNTAGHCNQPTKSGNQH